MREGAVPPCVPMSLPHSERRPWTNRIERMLSSPNRSVRGAFASPWRGCSPSSSSSQRRSAAHRSWLCSSPWARARSSSSSASSGPSSTGTGASRRGAAATTGPQCSVPRARSAPPSCSASSSSSSPVRADTTTSASPALPDRGRRNRSHASWTTGASASTTTAPSARSARSPSDARTGSSSAPTTTARPSPPSSRSSPRRASSTQGRTRARGRPAHGAAPGAEAVGELSESDPARPRGCDRPADPKRTGFTQRIPIELWTSGGRSLEISLTPVPGATGEAETARQVNCDQSSGTTSTLPNGSTRLLPHGPRRRPRAPGQCSFGGCSAPGAARRSTAHGVRGPP